jgi:glutamate synthase domain-containing protein 1
VFVAKNGSRAPARAPRTWPRKRIEHNTDAFPSLRPVVVYKAAHAGAEPFYGDFAGRPVESAGLVHPVQHQHVPVALAPVPMLAHNGEINTVQQRELMREGVMAPTLADPLERAY